MPTPKYTTLPRSRRHWREGEASLAVYMREISELNTNREEIIGLQKNLIFALNEDVTPRQREVLLLRYAECLSQAEIANQLGVARSTVSRTLARGEARLRKILRYGAAKLLYPEN